MYGTKWLPIVPIGIPGKIPVQLRETQPYQQVDSSAEVVVQSDREVFRGFKRKLLVVYKPLRDHQR